MRDEKLLLRQVVHDDRNAQHGGKRDKIRPGRTTGKPAPSVLPSATRRYRLLSAPTKVSSRRCPARPFARPLRQEPPRSIDQVDKSPCRLSRRHLTRQPLDGVRTPIGANIGKNGRTLRQQVFKQHDGGVAGVVFGSQDERRPFETDMHTRIYQQHPEVRCIIGACPVYSMAFAVTGAPLDLTLMPESYVQLRELRRISFREGLADPKNIARLLSPEAPALLWENSRLIVVGDSLLQVFDRLEVAEKTAQAIWTA